MVLTLLALLGTGSVLAQSPEELRVESGAARVQQEGSEARDALLLGLLWRRPAERWTFLTNANLTWAQDSVAAAQGVAALAIAWPRSTHLRTDAGVSGAIFSLQGLDRGGNGGAFVRQHWLVNQRGGAWLGTAMGRTSRDGVRSTSSAADVGAWGRVGPLYSSLSLGRVESTDWPLLASAGVTADPSATDFDLQEAQFVLQAQYGPHELAATGSWRRGIGLTTARDEAFTVSGVLQISERIALTASAGRQLADPVRGLPQADLATLILRFRFGARTVPAMPRAEFAETQFVAGEASGGTMIVRVYAPDTAFVEVAGSFSDWQSIPLELQDGSWRAAVRLPPGAHRIAVRVNRGIWRAPRNLARVRDDFGGEVGLIVVP